METVWIQNLKAFITTGLFRDDERWKKIFVEQLDNLEAEIQRREEAAFERGRDAEHEAQRS